MKQINFAMILLLALAAACSAAGQAVVAPPVVSTRNPQTAGQLVREMVANELAQHDASAWNYRMERLEKGITKTYTVVDSTGGPMSLPICQGGSPVSQEARSADLSRLRRLIASQDEMAKKEAQSKEDDKKVEVVLRNLPDGLLFEYDGGDEQEIRLKFEPNPNFKPPSLETRVFKALAGTLVINRAEKRMVRLEGHLMHDVSFGWGVLGNLRQGGTFKVAQTELASGYWALTSLDVEMDGKVLLFHNLDVKERLRLLNFHALDKPPSPADALALLEAQPRACSSTL